MNARTARVPCVREARGGQTCHFHRAVVLHVPPASLLVITTSPQTHGRCFPECRRPLLYNPPVLRCSLARNREPLRDFPTDILNPNSVHLPFSIYNGMPLQSCPTTCHTKVLSQRKRKPVRKALIVGISYKYTESQEELVSPHKDARDWKQFLQRKVPLFVYMSMYVSDILRVFLLCLARQVWVPRGRHHASTR